MLKRALWDTTITELLAGYIAAAVVGVVIFRPVSML